MDDFLRMVSSLAVPAFAISSMLAAGFSFTFREVAAPLRHADRVGRALVGNFVLPPLLAAGISRALALEPPLALAMVLLGCAAGAPFLLKLIATATGDVALGTGLLVLLVPMTVVFMPLLVPLLAPDASVNAGAIAMHLSATMLLPLVFGLLVRQIAKDAAARMAPVMRTLSSISLVLLLVSTIVVNLGDVIMILTSRAMVAVVLFVLGAFAIGYLIASPHPERRIVLGLGTAQRNVAAATIVAIEDASHPDTLVLVLVASVLDLAVLFPIAHALRRRRDRPHLEVSYGT